jgi:hypothetical protein
MYIVEIYPEEIGITMKPEEFRVGFEKALFMEGVPVGQWQTMPVPAQDLFQTKQGQSASGYPWNFTQEGKRMKYSVDDYPNAVDLCRRYTVIAGIHPPNGMDLMEKYVEAIMKVFSNLEAVIDHCKDDIVAHYSGAIFRAK